MINVLIYNEFVHEQTEERVRKVYPEGIHGCIKSFLESEDDISVSTVTLDNVNDITDEVLDKTDVIIWWGHMAHNRVPDEVAQRVQAAVLKGMGAIFLHSGHHSKPFRLLMGTSCNLSWREDGDFERVWVAKPTHPIARGLKKYIFSEHEETYAEPFDVPEPDVTVFIGGFEGGEVFRSGLCYRRGAGKIFYFQPGHETFPIYYNPDVQTVIKNAVHWANPDCRMEKLDAPNVKKPGFDGE
ncbi:MAG: ThuA domain-containing protein [Clostridia bacterium]|nr:ThuA domain-containing protein [Clostridia bacterium]